MGAGGSAMPAPRWPTGLTCPAELKALQSREVLPSSSALHTTLSLSHATPQPKANLLFTWEHANIYWLRVWVPVWILHKLSPLKLIKRKQESLLKQILRAFTPLNRASYPGFPYETPEWHITVSQLSFTSNQVIFYYGFSNNQAITGMAQKLWHAQEPSIPAKIWGKCRGWPLSINVQIMIKDLEMWFYL